MIRYFCNEQLAQGRPDQGGRPGTEFFLTRKLWDVGSSAPYGHRGDLTTLTETILAHGGEARAARDAFAGRGIDEQRAVLSFLRTLQILPENSPSAVIQH
ncbi:MAG TPA: di-heme oxidoredictase family protein [Gammaproteobacteria bacterium]|nr:di-heme oxidoredictase family protein [Gammaproteobacteria bacterium]